MASPITCQKSVAHPDFIEIEMALKLEINTL